VAPISLIIVRRISAATEQLLVRAECTVAHPTKIVGGPWPSHASAPPSSYYNFKVAFL